MWRRERQRRGAPVLWLAGGVVAGAAIGWLTAPRRGDWMRNQIRQKADHWERAGRRRLWKRGRDVRNRVVGAMAEVQHAWHPREHYVDANTLVDQVHSQIGRQFASVLEGINLSAVGHTVYLHGWVRTESDRDRLVEAVAGIEGVGQVSAVGVRVVSEPAGAESGPATKPRIPRRRAP